MEYYYSNKEEQNPIQKRIGLKVCGMHHNPEEVATLYPEYLGFIFWKPSKRYFTGPLPPLPHSIKKIGVFVDATISDIKEKIATYQLVGVQLHGNESPDFCRNLREQSKGIRIIKVFSIKDTFNFQELAPFEEVCDYYLFDTKGKLPGGNGYTFDWEVLTNYPSTKPFFLSGGIGLKAADKLKAFLQTPQAAYCHAIDINSQFETAPGIKEIEKLKTFKKILNA